jgi:hypothetical protein
MGDGRPHLAMGSDDPSASQPCSCSVNSGRQDEQIVAAVMFKARRQRIAPPRWSHALTTHAEPRFVL